MNTQPDQSESAYEATIRLEIRARGQDGAYRIQQAAARKLRIYVGDEGITAVRASMLDLRLASDEVRDGG